MRLTSTALVLLSAGAHAKVILVLGDSAAAFSGGAIGAFCGGYTASNKAIPGTSANQWGWSGGGCSTATPPVQPANETACPSSYCKNPGTPKTCQASTAVAATPGTVSAVWLSVGANDYDVAGCPSPMPGLAPAINDT